jgi:hypothetical protein
MNVIIITGRNRPGRAASAHDAQFEDLTRGNSSDIIQIAIHPIARVNERVVAQAIPQQSVHQKDCDVASAK